MARRRLAALAATAAALACAAPAAADTLTVQNRNDSGAGSLRNTIAAAQPNDTVSVPAGHYALKTGEILINKNLTVVGAGAGRTSVDAGGKSRVFRVTDGTVTLRKLQVTGGNANPGGGIEVTSILNLDQVVVSGNRAGGANTPGAGGGVVAAGAGTVELHLTNSTVVGNRAGGGGAAGVGNGGGIKLDFVNSAERTVTLDHSAVRGNVAGGNGSDGFGGGIDASSESTNSKLDMTLTDSTVATNLAGGGSQGFGGGIEAGTNAANGDLTLTLDRSTVSGNRTLSPTGAAGIDYQSVGNSTTQRLTITDSTVAGNTAPVGSAGGVVFANGGSSATSTVLVKHATIAGNSGVGLSAAGATVQNSIVANNGINCDGTVGGNAGNIEFGHTCGFTPGGNQVDTDPKLKPLGNYGGPTQTMPPRIGSPAIDNANTGLCTPTDQRGVLRPQGTNCDVGAVELQIADVGVTATLKPKKASAGKTVVYTYKLTNHGPQPAQGVALTDKLPKKLKLVAAQAAGGCTGLRIVRCAVGTLPLGASRTVVIKAKPLHAGTIKNTGRVSTFAGDPTPGNDAATTTLTALPSLTKLSVKPDEFDVGKDGTLRFRLSDAGKVTLRFEMKQGKKYVFAQKRTVDGHAGKNKRKLGASHLPHGRYRLTATVKAKGLRSKAARTAFRIGP